MALLDRGRAFRTVLWWQAVVTVIAALGAAYWRGPHGVISALSGGVINIVAGAVFARLAFGASSRTAGMALYAVLRAEACKIILIIAQLWLVLALYKQVVLSAFFGTFVLTVMLSTLGLIARDR